MKYAGGLVKKEREQIFKLFLEHDKLKFNEIEKAIKIRSNMVSYHLERMVEEGLLEKESEHYVLTAKAERYLPIITHITGAELGPLPVVLVAVVDDGKILLMKRNRRPYKGYWSLIGGKMLLEESFEDASKRLVKEKSSVDADFVSINSVMHERVEGEGITKHSFILFFTKMESASSEVIASEHGALRWFTSDELHVEKIIPSDLWLLKNKLDAFIDVKTAKMAENDGELSSFEIVNLVK